MVPPSSYGIPRVPQYSGYSLLFTPVFMYVTFTLFGWPSHAISLTFSFAFMLCLTPSKFPFTVWPSPLSLATTYGISFRFLFLVLLRCFSSDGSPHTTILFIVWCLNMTLGGFLHSDIHGSMSTYDSPWLFAVCRVLLRLLVPRHSPCALISLTICLLKTVVFLPFFLFKLDNSFSLYLYLRFYFLALLYSVFKVLFADFFRWWA